MMANRYAVMKAEIIFCNERLLMYCIAARELSRKETFERLTRCCDDALTILFSTAHYARLHRCLTQL